jgi:Ion channel
VEYFVVSYLVLDALSFTALFHASYCLVILARAWALLRVLDILQATVNVMLFDQLRGRLDNKVASKTRLVTLGFVNFLELLLLFGTLYASWLSKLSRASSPWDALYFSVMTQLTIGYGDMAPTGVLRAVAVAQSVAGLTFVALILARIIGSLPPIEEAIPPSST